MKMEFFQSELEDTKKRVEEKGQQKCERPETGHVSPLCRFCKMELFGIRHETGSCYISGMQCPIYTKLHIRLLT